MKNKKLYLTIDDAPSCFMQEKIDCLHQKNIPALWYCRGEFINEKTMPSLVYAIQKNFIIGNHSFSHPYFSTLTFQQAKYEITHTETLIKKAYDLAGIPQKYKLFRFPFLDKGGKLKTRLQDFLKQEGYQKACFENITYDYYQKEKLDNDIDAPWTFDACEYALFSEKSKKKRGLFTVEDFITRIHKNDPKKGLGLLYPDSNDIVLLHDFEQTHHLFEPIIDTLEKLPITFELPTFKR